MQPCVWEWMLYVRGENMLLVVRSVQRTFRYFFKSVWDSYSFCCCRCPSCWFLVYLKDCMRVRACKLRCIFERSLTKLLLGLCPFVCSELILEGFSCFFFLLFVCLLFYLPSELIFNSDVLLKVTSLFQDKKRKNSTINSRTLVSSPSGASFYGYFVAKIKMPFFWFWDLKCELVAKLYNRPRLQAV